MNKEGQFDLEARMEITPSSEFSIVRDLFTKGFHAEEIQTQINKTSDFEIREQKYTPYGGGLKLSTRSCKKKFLWFCKELEFNCEVNLSESQFKQICRLDFEKADAKTVFDKSLEVVNTIECSHQNAKFFCILTGKGHPRETLLTDSRRLAIAGSTETFRGFFQLKDFFERKSSLFPDPITGAKEWQAHYEASLACGKTHQVFKILGKTAPLKMSCHEVPIK